MGRLASFFVVLLVMSTIVFRVGNELGWGADCREGFVALYTSSNGWVCVAGYDYKKSE